MKDESNLSLCSFFFHRLIKHPQHCLTKINLPSHVSNLNFETLFYVINKSIMENVVTPPAPVSYSMDIRALNEKIQRESEFVELLTIETGKQIVGQRYMMERLLVGLLSQGHILLEGVPGMAKTLAIKTLAQAIHAKFSRI